MEIARKELPKVLMYVHTLCYTQYAAATGHGKMIMTFLDKIIATYILSANETDIQRLVLHEVIMPSWPSTLLYKLQYII